MRICCRCPFPFAWSCGSDLPRFPYTFTYTHIEQITPFHSTPRARTHATENQIKELITRSRLSESICQWICTRCVSCSLTHVIGFFIYFSLFRSFYRTFVRFFFVLIPRRCSVFSFPSTKYHMHTSRARKLFWYVFKWPGAEWFLLLYLYRTLYFGFVRQAHTHTHTHYA